MEYRFPAYNKSPGVIIGFIIWLVCIIPFAFVPVEITWQLLIPGIFILFFLYVLVASTFKLLITYYLSDKGLRIYKPPFHKTFIPFSDIQQLVMVTDKESEQLMEKLMLEQNEFGQNYDLVGYIKYIRKNTPVYKYFTFAPSAKVSTVGPMDRLTSVQLKTITRFIILSFTNGKFIFLSPKDPIAFMERYEALKSA